MKLIVNVQYEVDAKLVKGDDEEYTAAIVSETVANAGVNVYLESEDRKATIKSFDYEYTVKKKIR